MKIKQYLKNKYVIGGLSFILILGAFLAFRSNNSKEESVKIVRGNFEKIVSISGKVIPSQDVELSFDASGTVAGVYKKVGDTAFQGQVIAVLDSSDIRANRDKANADLLVAKAELLKIQNPDTSSEVSINKQQVVNTIIEAFTVSDDAIRNKVDQFFDDARTTGPEIKYTFYDYFSTKGKINDGRAKLELELVRFGTMANSLTINNYSDKSLKDTKAYVQKVKSFLDTVSFAVNSFEESSALTRSMIDGYRADVASARTNVNNILSDLISFEDDLISSISDVPIYEAKVKAAEANVRNFDAQVAKTVIVAPFNGVISFQDAKVGESVSQNTKVTSMISNGYEVEAYIPEVNISGINVGNPAKIKLDAYGGVEFPASIIHIDPAETVRDGVSNYKIKLAFDKQDTRILSGMTADVEIMTEKIADTIVVPERVLLTEEGKNYVMKITADGSIKVEVASGKKDGKGNIEITSGISEGDRIKLNPEQ